MEPAQILTVSLDTSEIVAATYWQLAFQAGRRLSGSDAVDALYDALTVSHRLMVVDQPETSQLLLTGGFDSRTVLGFLAEVGHSPDECLTWGICDSIPTSDPTVARDIAGHFGAPWRFLRYEGESFADRAEDWAYVSELGSDNLGSFAAGADFLFRPTTTAPAVFIGDQILGSGGVPLSRSDAIEAASGVPRSGMPHGVQSILRPEVSGFARRTIAGQLEDLAGRCSTDSPKDIQDFLTHQIRLARWLNAPNYFREPMVSPRRPMLFRPVLDVLQQLPPRLRVEKRALVNMLCRRMPGLMKYPKASANSLIDWPYVFGGKGVAADLFRNLLTSPDLLDGELTRMINPDAVVALAGSFSEGSRKQVSRTPARERGLAALRRTAGRVEMVGRGLRVAERGWRSLFRDGPGLSRDRVAMRLALLGALLRCMSAGRFNGDCHPAASPLNHCREMWPVSDLHRESPGA